MTLLVSISAVLCLKYPLLSLYKFLGQSKSFNSSRKFGNHAASKVTLTSSVVIMTKLLFSSKEFCVLQIQSNTNIFYLVVQ